MNLIFRPINYEKDRQNVFNITKSSGFFEEGEIELALQYFDECESKRENCDHKFLFAELDNKTIGYTNFGIACYTGATYYIHWIAILEEYRNKGLGKLLIFKTEEIIKQTGCKKIIVETSSKESYISTQKFYLNCGYLIEARLKKFYGENDDQIILSKEL